MDRNAVLIGALGLHLLVAGVHAGSHFSIPVSLGPALDVVVLVVVFVAPTAGVALAVRNHPAGIPLFATSMAGALVLGGALHFLVEGPDHVHAIPRGAWRFPFRASAVGLAVVEATGATLGAWYWYAR